MEERQRGERKREGERAGNTLSTASTESEGNGGRARERARQTEGGSARGREGAVPSPIAFGGRGAVAMAEGAPVPAETDPLLHEPDCPAGFKPDGEDSDNVAKFKSIIVTPAGEGLDGALRVSTRRHC